MTDAKPSFDVFHCPSCGKPTTANLPSCRHCKGLLRGPTKGTKTNAIFAGGGSGTKWGCLGSVVLLIAMASGGVAYCNHETAERARVDALQRAEEAKEEEARYQDRVRSGQVCADGPNDLNTALELNVKGQLKDPDSFEHMGTVITPSPKGGYDALMRFRSRNSFGGYVVGTAVATLYVAERGVCEVRTFKVTG